MFLQTLIEADVHKKLASLDSDLESLLVKENKKSETLIPLLPGRSIAVCNINEMPLKESLQNEVGQRRLIHDLAHIEMQAMELGLRTLAEYQDVPLQFKEQLLGVVLDEARHLKMLIKALEDRGGHWGEFPVHLSLWNAVSAEDDLIDRILIVHRYLEGSGLDAGDKILKRLYGVGNKDLLSVVKVIVDEEVGHVKFGSDWFKTFCEKSKLNSDLHFITRMEHLKHKLPKRMMKLNYEVRKQAGFSDMEINYLDQSL